jgi:OCT family organic cation transporter-like MFS transporter 4/5
MKNVKVMNNFPTIARFFITFTFFIVYIYTAELFPTVLRASVIGVASMAGRVGAITSAYIGELVRVNLRTLYMYTCVK